MSLKLIREPCPRCGGRQHLAEDSDSFGHNSMAFYAVSCTACGGISQYVGKDGSWSEETDSGAAAKAINRAEHYKPPERERISTTRDWVREMIGDAAIPIAEELGAGTYGEYAPEPVYVEDLMHFKQCPRCPEPKPMSEFYRNRSRKDGYADHCKVHHKAAVAASYARAQARKHEAPRVVGFPKESAIVTVEARQHIHPAPEPSLFRRLLSRFKRAS